MDQPAGASPAPSPVAQRYAIVFTARWQEYFRIWIVNLALSLLTFGIYSAWAKVRRKRYFYERTLLDGEPFEYRARPVAILKGRVVAMAVITLLWTVNHFVPTLFFAVLAVAVFLVPFLMVRSHAFNAANSAWRNVRFRFDGGYGECLRIVLAYGLFVVATLGIGYYAFKARMTEFIVRRHGYGVAAFDLPSVRKPFGGAYVRAIGMGLLAGLIVGGATMVLMIASQGRPGRAITWAVNLASYGLYLGLFSYIRSRVLNITWNSATVAGTVRFDSTLRATELYKLYLTNVLAIVATLGLATPWAVVRTMRYRAEKITVIADGGFDDFAATAAGEIDASGQEVGEMLDMDFGI